MGNRRGIIKMSNELVVNGWDQVGFIFKDFRPIHIEHRHWDCNYWYFYGVCDGFDEVTEGENAPEYSIKVSYAGEGEPEYKFIKA